MTKSGLLYLLLLPFVLSHALSAQVLSAQERGQLIFEDHFDRSESQETIDEVGNGWRTNSKSRASGNKQADLKDGALYITTHAVADHAASLTHEVRFKNAIVEIRFMLENKNDALGLDFADLDFKDVHAGHLFKVDVTPKFVQINDMKTGDMNMKFYDAKKAKQLTAEQKDFLTTTKKKFPAKLATNRWYSLSIEIQDDQVAVSIDGKEAGSFKSLGFTHPTKKMLRLAVPRSAVVDDLKIYSLVEFSS